MNRKNLIKSCVLCSVILILFSLIAQPGWALLIEHVNGTIYAEVGTTFNGFKKTVSGWEASGGVKTDDAIFANSSAYGYGHASGYKINGPLNNGNHARFILHSTAQSAAGNANQAYETYALVRSGKNPGDMIELQLLPNPAEVGMGVELTAEAVLSGTLNSGGLTGFMPWLHSGTAIIDFAFEIYKDPTGSPVLSFSYDKTITSDGKDNNTGTQTLEESIGLPDSLGIQVDTTTFKTGDHFYVYFEQLARAIVPSDMQSSAKAYAVQSTTDVISIAIEATPIDPPDPPPVQSIPEPSIILLLGAIITGIGIIERKKSRRKQF